MYVYGIFNLVDEEFSRKNKTVSTSSDVSVYHIKNPKLSVA